MEPYLRGTRRTINYEPDTTGTVSSSNGAPAALRTWQPTRVEMMRDPDGDHALPYGQQIAEDGAAQLYAEAMRTPSLNDTMTEHAGAFLHTDRNITREELQVMGEALRGYAARADTETMVDTVQQTMIKAILQQEGRSDTRSFGNTRPHPYARDFSMAPIIARHELLRLYPRDTVQLHGLLDECLHGLRLLFPSLQISMLYSYLTIQATPEQDDLLDDDEHQPPLLLGSFDDSECATCLLPAQDWFRGTRQSTGATIRGQDGQIYVLQLPLRDGIPDDGYRYPPRHARHRRLGKPPMGLDP